VILIVHEVIYNDTANHFTLVRISLRHFSVKLDSICHKHGETQKIEIQDVGSSLVISLKLAGCMILTQWNPLSFSDEVVD
jgi:hypothetical protein